jgi:hypothetical protein
MDIGICNYQPGDAALAEQFGATWARVGCDISYSVPDMREVLAEITGAGLRPVVDVRTHPAALRAPGALTGTVADDVASWQAAVRRYCRHVSLFLLNNPEVRDIEVWGSAEVAYASGQVGQIVDYGTILRDVFATVRITHPHVRVWTGGFGRDAQPYFINDGLRAWSPNAFDVCNMHPWPTILPEIGVTVNRLDVNLKIGRQLLHDHCGDQPFSASAFGVPTSEARAFSKRYGGARKVGGWQAVSEADAYEWYRACLGVFAKWEFEVVCLLAHDFALEVAAVPEHRSGLVHADGTPKEFTEALAEWCRIGDFASALAEVKMPEPSDHPHTDGMVGIPPPKEPPPPPDPTEPGVAEDAAESEQE